PAGDLDAAAGWALARGSESAGVYFYLNPLTDGARPDPGLKVGDIARRRWFLIDLDRRKADDETKDWSATDAEKESCRAAASAVYGHVTALGWPAPVLVDSGNGWHLLYRIDLANDDAAQAGLRRVLNALKGRFDTTAVALDGKVHNANRVSAL